MTTARLIESASAHLRLDEARAFVHAHLPHGDVWLVGASRGAADDLARAIAVQAGATVGLHRFSLTQLAVYLAGPELAAVDLAPVTYLGFGGGRRAGGVRGPARRDASLFLARRADAGISAGARAHAAGTAAGRCRRGGAGGGAPAARRLGFGGAARPLRGAVSRRACDRSRAPVSGGHRRIERRAPGARPGARPARRGRRLGRRIRLRQSADPAFRRRRPIRLQRSRHRSVW